MVFTFFSFLNKTNNVTFMLFFDKRLLCCLGEYNDGGI